MPGLEAAITSPPMNDGVSDSSTRLTQIAKLVRVGRNFISSFVCVLGALNYVSVVLHMVAHAGERVVSNEGGASPSGTLNNLCSL